MSKAYFYEPVTRLLFINIPDEDWEEGDEGLVGQLQISLYGTRDAAQNWAATYTKFLVKIGFQRGRASNCNFVQKRNIKMTVHGDDFLAVADLDQIKWIEEQLKSEPDLDQIKWIEEQLKSEYAIKAEVLGQEPDLSKEIKILNRSIRWCGDKLGYEADSRHAEIIIEECEVQSWRAAKTPGVQEAVVDGIEKGGVEMNDYEKTRFRGVAARINNLAMERSDLQFAAKELCRKMAKPEPKDWDKARRNARYLKFRPHGVVEIPFEQRNEKLDGFADSGWAGERPSMKSTSGGALKWRGSTLKSWSSTQTTTALSSAEAELYAMSKCAQLTASLISIARDSEIELSAVVHSDASAALGIAYRRGLGGKTRHVKVQFLWIQDAVENKELEIEKVGTLENPADMLTKFLLHDALPKHAQMLSLSFKPGRSSADKAADALAGLSGLEARLRVFTKRVADAKTLAATLAPFHLRT